MLTSATRYKDEARDSHNHLSVDPQSGWGALVEERVSEKKRRVINSKSGCCIVSIASVWDTNLVEKHQCPRDMGVSTVALAVLPRKRLHRPDPSTVTHSQHKNSNLVPNSPVSRSDRMGDALSHGYLLVSDHTRTGASSLLLPPRG